MTLKDWLYQKSISQNHFAQMINMSASQVNRIVNGEMKPCFSVACAIQFATKGNVKLKDLGVDE